MKNVFTFPAAFFAISVLSVLIPAAMFADDVALSGIDSRFLPVRGMVDLYVVVTDGKGMPVEGLQADDFQVRQAPVGEEFGEGLPIARFSAAGERREGIAFMMLIDDSGSMYDDALGRPSPRPDRTRAAMARREAGNFLDELGTSMDRAGLAVFGTRYKLLAGPRTDRASLMERLGISSPPQEQEAFTELYAAVVEASSTLSKERGRRIVILFSDGENYPYSVRTGNPHPEYGEEVFNADDALESLRNEGITLYAVRFGPNRDEDLARIAHATGGIVFDVEGEEELSGLYATIRERVLAEYKLGFRPTPTGAPETKIRVESADGSAGSELSFPSPVVFGAPSSRKDALLSLTAIPLSILVIVLLWRAKAAGKNEVPSLERLRPEGGGAATVALSGGRTIIEPGSGGAATTMMHETQGSGKMSGETIIVEKDRNGKWRVFSDKGVTVNNQKLNNATVLENGDVIRAGNELIVFDDGES